MSRGPRYLFCGDDFTGASDTLATLARAGLKTRLFLTPEGLEHSQEICRLDAAGLATAHRAMGPYAIAKEMEAVGRMVKRFSPRLFHYKVCSTFDSSPETGSIGAAITGLDAVLPNCRTMVLGGQPSLGRYCIFSNLFAAAPDKTVFRLDCHPTMSCHPITPMSCADIRQILTDQGLEGIKGVHWPLYENGYEQVRQAAEQILGNREIPLFDVMEDKDLSLIGQILYDQVAHPVVAVGASSVAQAYVAAGADARTAPVPQTVAAPEKPVFIMAGSRSQATAAQVKDAVGFERVTISPKAIEANTQKALDDYSAACQAALAKGAHVLAVVADERDHTLGRGRIAGFTAELITRICASGMTGRLGIAGGDTSSLALQHLKVESLSFVADVEPGICLCRLHAPGQEFLDGLEVILKGGQMGSSNLFTALTGPIPVPGL